MDIIVEIGNSAISIALYDGPDILHLFRIATHPHRDTAYYTRRITDEITACFSRSASIRHAALCSVVPAVTPALIAALNEFGCDPMIISAHLRTTVGVRPEHVDQIGNDLLANCEAAVDLHPPPLVVVDFGTALTCTGVDDSGCIVGVAIAPGIPISAQALYGRTAQLEEISYDIPPRYLGTDTQSAMQSGVMHGFIGLTTALIAGIQQELGGLAHVIATGGQSCGIAQRVTSIHRYIPTLTIDGIRLIAENNRLPT